MTARATGPVGCASCTVANAPHFVGAVAPCIFVRSAVDAEPVPTRRRWPHRRAAPPGCGPGRADRPATRHPSGPPGAVRAVMNVRLLDAWLGGHAALGLQGTRYGRARLSDPFYFADQDAVNAMTSARLDDSELDIHPHAPAPHAPFAGVRLSASGSADHVLCNYADGPALNFLHHTMAKPWLQATRTNSYSRLLTRLLLSEDVAVRLERRDLPLRLPPGYLGELDRRRTHTQAVAGRGLRGRVGVLGIWTRLEDRRRAAWK